MTSSRRLSSSRSWVHVVVAMSQSKCENIIWLTPYNNNNNNHSNNNNNNNSNDNNDDDNGNDNDNDVTIYRAAISQWFNGALQEI